MPPEPLSLLVKPAGADCNLNCTYCFYLPKQALYPDAKVRRMPLEVAEEMVRQYMPLGGASPSFGWQGGEPTLMGLDFFKRVVGWQQQYGVSGQTVGNGLQTNGLLLDEEWAKFLAEYNFLLGVSVDGPQDLHDHYRRNVAGGPSWERVMRVLDILRQHSVEFNILVLLNDRNVKEPRRVYDFLRQNDLNFVQFIPCVEQDPSTGLLAPYSVTPEEYGAFLCALFDEWYGDGQTRFYERMFDDTFMAYMGYEQPTCLFRKKCGNYVVVEHNGDVYACDFFVEPDWQLGNLTETPLQEIVRTPRALEFRDRKWKELPADCEHCRFRWLCQGGCPKHRLALPDGTPPPNYFCRAYQRLWEHSEGRMHELKKRFEAEERVRQQELAFERGMTSPAAPAPDAAVPPAKTGRNDPCPCGSGKKYKKCCGHV
ncbi:MAG: anaerobic sulfatase maturase [Armatimonadetes bacterium CG_4_10_14_3_um_filter_66_18]|nr:anaerobic sulfatase maturase [Armatimonadota bacterium]OIO95077.1 MAG: anaerobic sulfatase maturase [Armatimonadetes bacterium CG2_30_66_41]PIU93012.1 MAG: anaerobic sulfatase maturase [Armatimonadetes bacterium CG06_land_8_20_14_3_00_66_21]PIX44327.1 MAG: anaerobic sulfatase maturase [Armatimonadetes bacterium CG_4_8_14_3_um_filter_66_20]PIY53687.1 MAG: anaerobic sulfatase maturase [Armatimonadetes bacterium CG_4_10_14_3_um_filter_66_18]PIZ49775.1 MAG: anaerobic sulfatase maturase [Armatim